VPVRPRPPAPPFLSIEFDRSGAFRYGRFRLAAWRRREFSLNARMVAPGAALALWPNAAECDILKVLCFVNGGGMVQWFSRTESQRLAEALHEIVALSDHVAAQADDMDYQNGYRVCEFALSICDQVTVVSKAISHIDPRVRRILDAVAEERNSEERRTDYRRDLLLPNSPAEPDWNPPY
jgi:hypothetical protein